MPPSCLTLLPLIFLIRLQEDSADYVTEQGDQGSRKESEYTEFFALAPELAPSTFGLQPTQGLETTEQSAGLSEEERNAKEEL